MRFTVLLAFFYSQSSENIFQAHILNPVEYLIDCTLQLEENCEENTFTANNNDKSNIVLEKYLTGSVYPCTLSGIRPFIWQPPE